MASKHREQKIIDAVACPQCGAKRGELCKVHEKSRAFQGRPVLHSERRAEWQKRESALIACPHCAHALAPEFIQAANARIVGQLGGRPLSEDRCPCGEMTLKRAAARRHVCESPTPSFEPPAM